ncbi:MAG: hypothetical protein JRJ85_12115 [Deltaproteobacteria bacterium]|nr:hypothetical protein [Deltaproteobacteria bacterium]
MNDQTRIMQFSAAGNHSAAGISVGLDELSKGRAAFAKLLVPELDTDGIPPFGSFRDAYTFFTGDPEINGVFKPEKVSAGLRACMGFNSASFSYGLQNALRMYVSKIYKTFPYHEDKLISEKKKANDFRLIHSVQLGYFGDLPNSDPETADWSDIGSYEDSEAQYRVGQKGAIVWVTRRHIINDSIDLIKNMCDRLARAARMTHAKYVWNFYIQNALCPDGTAWFTADHGNLGVNALSVSSLITGLTALANMEEPGSGEKLGIDFASFNWHLVVPIALWDLGARVNQTKSYFSSDDLTAKIPSAVYRLFGGGNERIVVCPFLSDANDWGILRDVGDVPIVEMGYLNGLSEPELIIAKGPKDNQVLAADKIGYKIRHEYGGTLAGYQGGYKSVVT